MRKLVALFTVLALLFCFAGCSGSDTDTDTSTDAGLGTNTETNAGLGTSSTKAPTNTESVGSASQSTSSKQTIVFPDPVTGTYNGKTVTISYRAITDIEYVASEAYCYFINGYATWFNPHRSNTYNSDGWSIVDFDGNSVFVPWPESVDDLSISSFDQNGIAVLRTQKEFGKKSEYTFINTKGETVGTATEKDYDDRVALSDKIDYWGQEENSDGSMKISQKKDGGISVVDADGKTLFDLPDEFDRAVFRSDKMVIACDFPTVPWSVYDNTGKRINQDTFSIIGNMENGLCPIINHKTNDDGTNTAYLGLMGENGEIVIPPTLETDSYSNVGIFFSEGHIITEYKGLIAILQVTVE
ncbi:MAG: hypothetical protein IJY56_00605 [Clostridia bacterium]|nr:hypothetical protein [Clostridia bacterium]